MVVWGLFCVFNFRLWCVCGYLLYRCLTGLFWVWGFGCILVVDFVYLFWVRRVWGLRIILDCNLLFGLGGWFGVHLLGVLVLTLYVFVVVFWGWVLLLVLACFLFWCYGVWVCVDVLVVVWFCLLVLLFWFAFWILICFLVCIGITSCCV